MRKECSHLDVNFSKRHRAGIAGPVCQFSDLRLRISINSSPVIVSFS